MLNNEENKLQKKIDEMQKVQAQLISIASHDLKTPLTCIIGFAKIIEQKPDMDENIKEKCIDAIIQESERMLKMLNNILSWQQIKAEKIKLSAEHINFSSLLSESTKNFQDKINKNNLKLILNIEDKLSLQGDKYRLEEIMGNLLDNAVKYSENGREIELKAWKTSEKNIKLVISDNGCGIDENIKETLFDGENPSSRGIRGEKGAGLGLFITKKLVEIHGGKIWFESSPGKGAKFYIEFNTH